MQKKIFLPTYLPYFFSGRYRKQTIIFLGLRPNLSRNLYLNLSLRKTHQFMERIHYLLAFFQLENLPSLSQSTIAAPNFSILLQMDDFPLAIPPVRPITYGLEGRLELRW